jgi:hypothetical protein
MRRASSTTTLSDQRPCSAWSRKICQSPSRPVGSARRSLPPALRMPSQNSPFLGNALRMLSAYIANRRGQPGSFKASTICCPRSVLAGVVAVAAVSAVAHAAPSSMAIARAIMPQPFLACTTA